MTYFFLFAFVFMWPVLANLYAIFPYHSFLQPNSFDFLHPVAFFAMFFWTKMNKVGPHGKEPCAASHRLNSLYSLPERSDISKIFIYDPNTEEQHAREARQLYGTILAPKDASPLCGSIKQNKTKT